MRVPLGLFLSCRITAALSSNRMYEPSGRPYSLAWRTITALTTSPFLTEPPGVASLTEATITSPTEASNFEPPATTRMHISSRAPVLSATRTLVCGMIIGLVLPSVLARNVQDLDGLARTATQDLLDNPVLVFADRAGLGNQYGIADLAPVGLVVSLETARAAQRAAIQPVTRDQFDVDHHRLVHLVARDATRLGPPLCRALVWHGLAYLPAAAAVSTC